jgi:hypothetical protein
MAAYMAGRRGTGSPWYHCRVGPGVSLMFDVRPRAHHKVYAGYPALFAFSDLKQP